MSCKYKYNNQWYTKEEVFSLLLKKRNINSKGELIKPNISNPKLSKKFEVVNDWDINDDGSSKTIKRFNTKEEADEYIKNIQEFHEAAGYKYGVIETPFATNGIEPKITNETLKESIENIKDKVVKNKFTDPDLNFENFKKEELEVWKDKYGKWYIATKEKNSYGIPLKQTLRSFIQKEKAIKSLENAYNYEEKEYTSQALINTKIAALKEAAKKYPRSLIRSEVKRINTSSSQELYDQFGADELPFQKISKDTQELFDKIMNTPSRVIDEKIKNCL